MNRIRHALAAVFFATAAAPQGALAQGAASYPNRIVKIVLPLAPGGPTDLFARMLAAHMEKKYGQPAIVDNRPGAGGIIAYDSVAKADPDGYTLVGSSGSLYYESMLNKEAQHDYRKVFQPVGIFAGTGLFLAVHSSVPVKNLAEFIAYARANPGKLNYGTSGRPTADMEELRERLGIRWEVVNYKGGAPAFQALAAGEVQVYTPDVNQLKPAMEAGKVRGIAYGDRTRAPRIPEVPTFVESNAGLNDFLMRVWLGISAHASVPADIVTKLNADVVEVSKTPEATKRFDAMGWAAMPLTPVEIRKDVEADVRRIQGLLEKGVKLR